MVVFEQLKTRLGELQSRLVPLESKESGVVKLIAELQDIRDKLVVKIRRIEGGEEGDLAARVKAFAEAKRELRRPRIEPYRPVHQAFDDPQRRRRAIR